ncbi:integrase [Streptacidiphilus sp. MAP12-20]|uniref:hypothetical protein n=1 Tax=Streptacidiphilus sp. MAP12-20 TaxID=3156299 RepID=UPI003518C495
MPVQPDEFAVAVERYLAATQLSEGSRRVYRISLTSWAWTLVGLPTPAGQARRGATPPVVPLSALDEPGVAARLRAALVSRSPRTRNRELSALRSAVRWWRAQGWLASDPLRDLDLSPVPDPTAPLTTRQLHAVLGLRATLRDQTLWHLLHDSGGTVAEVLALDIADLDRPHRRTHDRGDRLGLPRLTWGEPTARLLTLLLLSRTAGPVFLRDRRAPASTPAEDRCPLTGRARLSYRRAAELFTEATRPLDPTGRGWTLHCLRTPPQAGEPMRPPGRLLV